jgi:hypothetical protein
MFFYPMLESGGILTKKRSFPLPRQHRFRTDLSAAERFLHRPSLTQRFPMDAGVGKTDRNGKLREVGKRFRYRRQEVIQQASLYNTTIRRRLKKR